MRVLVTIALVLAAVLVAADGASATARVVAKSESLGAPALAGDTVVYAGVNRRRGVELRNVESGRSRVLARLGTKLPDRRFETRVDASESGIAIATARYKGLFDTGVFASLLGGPTGPLSERPTVCVQEGIDAAVAVDGERVAYVREVCARKRVVERYVVIENLKTGERVAELPTGRREIALDGRFLAHYDPWARDSLHVYDIESGSVVYGMHVDEAFGFDVDDDGTLVVSEYAYSGCEGDLRWASPSSPVWHTIDGCDTSPPLFIEDGKIAHGRGYWVRVSDLRGRGRNYGGRALQEEGYDFDGQRLAYSTEGCSPDTGRIYVDDLKKSKQKPPRAPACRVELPKVKTVRVDSKNRVTVKVSCRTGCRGSVMLTPRRGRGFFAHRSFELQRGQSARLRMTLTRPTQGFGRDRTAEGELRASVFQPVGGGTHEVVRRVTLRR